VSDTLFTQYVTTYLPKVGDDRPPEVSERNWEMLQALKGYRPMASIAREYGVTRSRVGQIVASTIRWATGVAYEDFKKEMNGDE
jgi:DNA-binding phage protein